MSETDEPATQTFGYLVLYDRGPLGFVGLDRDRAHEYARNTEGVVVEVPIIADYRKVSEGG